MPWIEICLQIAADQVPRAEAVLEASGALSLTLRDAGDDPILEPLPGATPVWADCSLSALFAENVDTAAVRGAVVEALHGEPATWRVDGVAERNWERAWMDDFQPMRFGDHLWVVPHSMAPPDPTAVNLRFDPGLAFGTGHHATTALCLEYLDRRPPRDAVVVDYGCGSGVLAVAALSLGARQAYAVDNDHQALAATLENAERNGVAERLCLLEAGETLPEHGDLVVANILSRILIELAPTLIGGTRRGGRLLLSGILASQSAAVRAAYASAIEFTSPHRREGWVRLEGVRR